MKRQWLAGIAAGLCVILCGCEPSPSERQRVKDLLPPGCVVHDLGGYGRIDQLVVITCDGRATQTTSAYEWHGKHGYHWASTLIEPGH